MIRRPRHVRLSATAGVAGSDTDALQTDVMRFMSIIGLCLMAIFALVQGMPVQDATKTATTAQFVRLREIIRMQQQQLQTFQRDLHALNANASRKKFESATVQRRLMDVIDEATQMRMQRDRVRDALDVVRQKLQQAQQSLIDAEEMSRNKSQHLVVLEKQLSVTQQLLDDSHTRLAQLQRQEIPLVLKPEPVKPQAASPVRKAEPAPHKKPEPKTANKRVPQAEKQGFSLQFASDEVLDRLVTRGQVSLYAIGKQQAWKFMMRSGKPVAAPVNKPRWYHEMSTLTVPAHYLRSLASLENTAAGVTWGVQLPAETRSVISSLAHGRQGGALVIRTDGKVVLQE